MAPRTQIAYNGSMSSVERTPRQRIKDLLTITPLTTRRIAEVVGIPERQVEEHLHHIVQSVVRDQMARFVLEPAACKDCDFVFRERNRITRPSRCPKCRSEAISEPRYSIEPKKSGQR
jgi:transcriptional regulator